MSFELPELTLPIITPSFRCMKEYLDVFVANNEHVTVMEIFRLLHSELDKFGVKVSYSDNYAIFSLRREYDLSMSNPFIFGAISECNGYVAHIIQEERKRVVVDVVPARCFNRYNKLMNSAISHMFKQYTVSYIMDGTIVSLYHSGFSNRWHISSTNGINVSNNKWMGPRTFAEIVSELLIENGVIVKLDEEGYIRFDGDIDYCHTFGFHYRDFHPIKDSVKENYLWQIQSVNLKTLAVCKYFENIRTQVTKSFSSFRELFVPDIENHYHYGYILDSNIPGPLNRVIIESSFAIMVKTIFYDIEPSISKEMNSICRKNYVMMRALLTKKYNKFVADYVDVTTVFKEYSVFVDGIVDDALAILTARFGGIVMPQPTGTRANIANKLISRIVDKSILNKIGNKDYDSVIEDVIRCPANAATFAHAME